jgi:hypothetical protein
VNGSIYADGGIKEVFLKLAPPSLEDNSSDFDRIARAARDEQGVGITGATLEAMRNLPENVRDAGWEITLTLVAERRIGQGAAGERKEDCYKITDVRKGNLTNKE